MTYDAAGHLLTQTDQHFGASWTFLGTDYLTYTYDSAGHALTERINHFGTTGSFTGSNIDIFSYNSAEQLITWTSWAYNSSGLAYKDVYGNVQARGDRELYARFRNHECRVAELAWGHPPGRRDDPYRVQEFR